MAHSENIHATAVLLAGKGVLIRGPSGSGKSLLALSLIDWSTSRGEEALLVADDRVDLVATDDGIHMSAPPTIAGLIELRGRGIIERPHRDNVRLDLVVDLLPALERMPDAHDFSMDLLGHIVARCPIPHLGVVGMEHQRLLIAEALHATAIGR
jgi:serine kinase of HPr protein (carbohydrate metabolism regulator)